MRSAVKTPGTFAVIALLCSAPARAQTATIVSPIASPIYVNIYWDATWDADAPMTKAALDSLTAAVLDSSYTAALSEYGITGARFGGGFLASPACGATAPRRVPIIDLFGPSLQRFVECEVTNGGVPTGPSVIYNVIMPPATLEADLFGAVTACTSTFSAYHFHSQLFGGAPFTAIFSNGACGNLVDNMTHEMVEAATDPFPPLNVVLSGMGEIADEFCSGSTVPFLSTFGKGPVSVYWSNARQLCVTGLTGGVSPAITSVTTSGFGNVMTASIVGTGFGMLPPSRSLPATTTLAYLAVSSVPTGWEAGNALNSDPVLVTVTSWTDTKIDLGGFLVPAGATFSVQPGDTLRFSVCNPASGGCASRTTALPPRPVLSSVTPASGPAGGKTAVVITGAGFVAPLQVTFGSQPAANVTIVSPTQIRVDSPPSVPGPAAVQVVRAGIASTPETFTYCAPVVQSLSPGSGPAIGGTPVTIAGTCFTGATSVRFGPKSGTAMQVVNDSTISVTSPSAVLSASCGFVNVQVVSPQLNGSISSASSANSHFTYGVQANCLSDPRFDKTLCELRPNSCPRPRVKIPPTLPGDLFQENGPRPDPRQYVTRAELAQALDQVFEWRDPKAPFGFVFSDVEIHDVAYPSFNRIQAFIAAYQGPGGSYAFYPSLPVERQEAAAAVVAMLGAAGELPPARENRRQPLSQLRDLGEITVRLAPAVGVALDRGLLSADSGIFRPKAFLTRAEFVDLVGRLGRR